jgi:Ca-activated chloride channel homolog
MSVKVRMGGIFGLLAMIVIGALPVVEAQSGRKSEPPPPPPRPQAKPKPKVEPNSEPAPPRETREPKPADDQDGETLKIGTELVSVPFSVTNKQNRYVNDLSQQNIQILEDGKPQEIFSFLKESDQPLTIAILFDISGSQQRTIPQQRAAAAQFVQKVMRPDKDLVGVITFRGDVEIQQKLTNSVNLVRRALDSIRFRDENAYVGRGGTPPVMGDPSLLGTSLYDAVYVTADEMLNGEAGRRVIIMLTDGEDTTSQYDRKKATEMALKAETLVYVIGIRGESVQGGGVYYSDVRKGDMEKLCEPTGGRAFFPERDTEFARAFQQIEEDLRQQYVVSYSPENSNRDGKFRSIAIKISGRQDMKDLRVLTRKGYYAK